MKNYKEQTTLGITLSGYWHHCYTVAAYLSALFIGGGIYVGS